MAELAFRVQVIIRCWWCATAFQWRTSTGNGFFLSVLFFFHFLLIINDDANQMRYASVPSSFPKCIGAMIWSIIKFALALRAPCDSDAVLQTQLEQSQYDAGIVIYERKENHTKDAESTYILMYFRRTFQNV